MDDSLARTNQYLHERARATNAARLKRTASVKHFLRHKYAWPGGYPMYAVCNDGEALCHACTKEHAKLILRATRANDRSGWNVRACGINYEDSELYCCDCGETIEAAYV